MIGLELWDRCAMREDPIEADRVLMTVLAELEADLHHMNVGSLFGLPYVNASVIGIRSISDRTRILDISYASFLSNIMILHHTK